MKKKNTVKTGIVFNKQGYVISDMNIFNFIIRYILVFISTLLIVYISFNSFNIHIEMKAIFKIDAILAFILMLADINIIAALAVNSGLIYILYKYIENNFEILKNGILAIMNESYSVIRIAFSLPEVDGFDKIMTDTSFTINMVAHTVTVAVVIITALIIGRYMSKILYGVLVSLLLGFIKFGGGNVDKKFGAALIVTLVIVCVLNLCSKRKILFGNRFKPARKNTYFQKGDSLYISQLCFIACIIGTAALLTGGAKSLPKDYTNSLKATVRDIAVMKYVEYKDFNNRSSFDAGQVGYQAYFKPDMKKIKTVQLDMPDDESVLLREFIGQDYNYRMNMWTSADTEDINSYLNIDDENKKITDKICAEQNFLKNEDAAKAVADYLINNYTYSITTQTLPYGKDFVNNFLEDDRKGNSTHFASAAVLILRDMGIPARYVSGYKIDDEQILASKYDRKSGKFNVDITNANVYAWVEIYDSEKGWINVNVSDPPSMEETKKIIEEENNKKEHPNTDINNYFRTVDKEKYTPKNIMNSVLKALAVFIITAVLTVIALILLLKAFKFLNKIVKYMKASDSEKASVLINSLSEKTGANTNSLKELGALLKERGNSSETVDKTIMLAEKIMFSPSSEKNDIKKLNKLIKSLKQ